MAMTQTTALGVLLESCRPELERQGITIFDDGRGQTLFRCVDSNGAFTVEVCCVLLYRPEPAKRLERELMRAVRTILFSDVHEDDHRRLTSFALGNEVYPIFRFDANAETEAETRLPCERPSKWDEVLTTLLLLAVLLGLVAITHFARKHAEEHTRPHHLSAVCGPWNGCA